MLYVGGSGIMETMSEKKINYKQGKLNALAVRNKELVRLRQRLLDDGKRVQKLEEETGQIGKVVSKIETLEQAQDACRSQIEEAKKQAKVTGDVESAFEVQTAMKDRIEELEAQIRLAYYGRG